MENYFYFTVKLAAASYILYKIWQLLFNKRLFGLWDRLLTPKARKESRPTEKQPAGAVIGQTDHALLADPRKAVPEPVATTDLEPTGFIGQQEPVTADDVDAPESPYVPSENELYGDTPSPDDNEMSSGVAFEDLGNAVDVLKNGTQDEPRRVKAAKTLYDIQNTEIMDILISNVCRSEDIENLINGTLDVDGFPLKKQDALAGFDIGNYV